MSDLSELRSLLHAPTLDERALRDAWSALPEGDTHARRYARDILLHRDGQNTWQWAAHPMGDGPLSRSMWRRGSTEPVSEWKMFRRDPKTFWGLSTIRLRCSPYFLTHIHHGPYLARIRTVDEVPFRLWTMNATWLLHAWMCDVLEARMITRGLGYAEERARIQEALETKRAWLREEATTMELMHQALRLQEMLRAGSLSAWEPAVAAGLNPITNEAGTFAWEVRTFVLEVRARIRDKAEFLRTSSHELALRAIEARNLDEDDA